MQTKAQAALSLPLHGLIRASAWLRRSAQIQGVAVSIATAVVVGVLLVGLPAKQASGQPLPTIAPTAPEADSSITEANLALDTPFMIQFTKPMNEGSVEAAITIDPKIDVDYRWDALGRTLAIAPSPHWSPETRFSVDISTDATDQQGLTLTSPIHASFRSGALTAGFITATRVFGEDAAPNTAFQVRFSRPVKLATVMLRLGISPQVDVTVFGDDPVDQTSQIFTLTPKEPLKTDTTYLLTMSNGGTDAAGSDLQPVKPLQIRTLAEPEVTFSPQDGAVVYDTNQPITLQFTEPMDQKSTEAAVTVLANGYPTKGSFAWSEDSTSLTFTPRRSYAINTRVTVKLSTAAKSGGGLHPKTARSSVIHISTPRSRNIKYTQTKITWTGGSASSTSPWMASELYYLELMNCTRTGRWVTSSGACSTQTRHTRPAQPALRLNASISNKAARPYASKMADLRVLTHYLNGTTPASRMAAAGFPYGGGENIASPGNSGQSGMVAIELFYQSESTWRGTNHYTNIMNKDYHQVGIGVWVSRCVRVVIEFYP
jgi:hypothetical protein